MFTAGIFFRGNPLLTICSKTFPSHAECREWAEGYIRRHPTQDLDWEFV